MRDTWIEIILKAAHKWVIDSLPALFKNYPTNLNLMLKINQSYQEIDNKVTPKQKAYAEIRTKDQDTKNKVLAIRAEAMTFK